MLVFGKINVYQTENFQINNLTCAGKMPAHIFKLKNKTEMATQVNYQKIWDSNDSVNRSFFLQIELKLSIQEAEKISALKWNQLNLIYQIQIKDWLNK